jgi:hypothetical protein
MATARYGEMSRNPVLKRWHVPSNSRPGHYYEIQLHDDGVLTCNCRGWINHANRVCIHVREKVSEANAFLSGQQIVQQQTNYLDKEHKLDKFAQQVVPKQVMTPVQKPKFRNHRMIRVEVAQG